jgi:hypothetical protein
MTAGGAAAVKDVEAAMYVGSVLTMAHTVFIKFVAAE